MLIETERLILRPMVHADEQALAAVLVDAETMRWYPRPYTEEEVRQWIDRQIGRYRDGCGLLGMVEKRTGRLIGDCGSTWQDVEGRMELEIGYHLNRERWSQGFATEAANAVIEDVFRRFRVDRLVAIIRPENVASRRVAEKNGMKLDRIILWRDYNHCIYQRMRST